MKKKSLITAATLLLASCQTNEAWMCKQLSNPTTGIRSILHGYWYEVAYIVDIKKTKSPSQSKGELATIVELYIDTLSAIGDTIEVGAPSVHEGSSFRIVLEPGSLESTVQTDIVDYETESNSYKLGYSISDIDTTLIVYHCDKNKKLLGQTEYKKAPASPASALQYMVNKTLFSGSYNTIDSSGLSLNIEMSSDGVVTGLPNYKEYYVITDFVAELGNSLDKICFDIQTLNQKCYAFKIQTNTIEFFDVEENSDGDVLPRGSARYVFVKK